MPDLAWKAAEVTGSVPTWEEWSCAVVWDGAFVDLYVEKTTAVEWDSMLEFIKGEGCPLRYSVDGEAAELPGRAEEIFGIRERASPLLEIDLGGCRIDAHFFEAEQIELVMDPREVDGPESLGRVLGLVRGIGRRLGKDMLVAPENGKEFAFLRYRSGADEWVWRERGS